MHIYMYAETDKHLLIQYKLNVLFSENDFCDWKYILK